MKSREIRFLFAYSSTDPARKSKKRALYPCRTCGIILGNRPEGGQLTPAPWCRCSAAGCRGTARRGANPPPTAEGSTSALLGRPAENLAGEVKSLVMFRLRAPPAPRTELRRARDRSLTDPAVVGHGLSPAVGTQRVCWQDGVTGQPPPAARADAFKVVRHTLTDTHSGHKPRSLSQMPAHPLGISLRRSCLGDSDEQSKAEPLLAAAPALRAAPSCAVPSARPRCGCLPRPGSGRWPRVTRTTAEHAASGERALGSNEKAREQKATAAGCR